MEFYSCHEHVEEAMDHIIDENEVAPEIEKIKPMSKNCSFCQQEAVYKISG